MTRHALAAAHAPPPLDRDALLVALVLAPATYSRNRFFDLYKDPEVRRVRRRASTLRSVLGQLASPQASAGMRVACDELPGGVADVAYELPAVGLKRTVRLESLELALLRFALASRSAAVPPALSARDDDRARVEGALARLAPG